jgi:hypothetical protein
MTRPVPWRRSTAAERRANRERFRQLREQVDASPETAKRREQHRVNNRKWWARAKIKKLLRGEGTDPFGKESLRVLTAADVAKIEAGFRSRYNRLSADQKQRLLRNGFLVLAWLSDPQFVALADYQRPEKPR